MPATYGRVNWKDGTGNPGGDTAVDAANLNVMDAGIATIYADAAQTGAGNLATTPLQFIVVGPSSANLPAAGTKGRIAFVVPFALP